MAMLESNQSAVWGLRGGRCCERPASFFLSTLEIKALNSRTVVRKYFLFFPLDFYLQDSFVCYALIFLWEGGWGKVTESEKMAIKKRLRAFDAGTHR